MSAADPKRRAYERQLAQRFARGRPLAVAAEAIEELQSRFKLPTWEAWQAAAELMRQKGQPPTAEEVRSALATADRRRRAPAPRDRQAGGGLLHSLLAAMGKWALSPYGQELRFTAPSHVRDFIADLATHPREELALAEALVAALTRLNELGSAGKFVLADGRTIHATALLKLPDASAREVGRQLLETITEEMEQTLAGDITFHGGRSATPQLREVFASLHAMAVNNLAQAWEQCVDGDRRENLRRAIAIYERCCDLPARQADPEKHLHSLHHLALAQRYLAHEVDDPDERGRLLDLSRQSADRALALPSHHPSVSFPMLDALRLNRANTEIHWLLHQGETGLIPAEEAETMLRQTASAALEWLKNSPIRARPEGEAALPFFAQFLSPNEPDRREEYAVNALQSLAQHLMPLPDRRDHRFMTRDEAQVALAAMTLLTPRGVPSRRVLADINVHSCLPIIIGALHPRDAGVRTSRALYLFELAWMRPILRRLGPLGRKYIDDACEGMHRWMCDPDLPGSHRRLFAGQIAALAELALDTEVGLEDLSALERARLHDLAGGAFYRAESSFYGQGVAHDAPDGAEPAWRIGLYRARQDLDACATILTYEEFADTTPAPLKPAIEAMLGELRKVQEHDPGRPPNIRLITNAAEESRVLRNEILHRCAFGRKHDWSPSFIDTTPAPSVADIDAWLRASRSTAVLLAHGGDLVLVYSDKTRSGAPHLDDLAKHIADDWPAMLALAHKLFDAWAALLMDPEDEAQAHGDLTAVLDRVVKSAPWRAFASKLSAILQEHGITTLALVERGLWRTFPWENLVIDDHRLADQVALVHLPTLAPTGAKPAPLREGVLAYVASPSGVASQALDYGRAALAAIGNPIQEPLGRDDFERACARVGTIRLFTHGSFNKVDAPLSGIHLDESHADELPYQGYEILTMDLRGCGRVELWACESGVQMDFLGGILGNDEPLGIASCFLLAGAHVVVGSTWKQPALVAALIAAAFAAHAGPPGSAARDARALAKALTAYRNVVADDGVFETALKQALLNALATPTAHPRPIPSAMRAAWCAAATYLTGNELIDLPLSVVEPFQANDPLLDDARTLDDPEEIALEVTRIARRLTDPLRAESASAGWRVLARDKSTF